MPLRCLAPCLKLQSVFPVAKVHQNPIAVPAVRELLGLACGRQTSDGKLLVGIYKSAIECTTYEEKSTDYAGENIILFRKIFSHS